MFVKKKCGVMKGTRRECREGIVFLFDDVFSIRKRMKNSLGNESYDESERPRRRESEGEVGSVGCVCCLFVF